MPVGAAGPQPQYSHGAHGVHGTHVGTVPNVLSLSPCWLCPSFCSRGEGKRSKRAEREGWEGEMGDGKAAGRAWQQLGCTESRVQGGRASPAAPPCMEGHGVITGRCIAPGLQCHSPQSTISHVEEVCGHGEPTQPCATEPTSPSRTALSPGSAAHRCKYPSWGVWEPNQSTVQASRGPVSTRQGGVPRVGVMAASLARSTTSS